MTAQEFDHRFDEGEDITPYIDESTIRRPGLGARRVNVIFRSGSSKNLICNQG
jgi:hypothetical protein